LVEHCWAEPYNDRFNWTNVYEACPAGGRDRQFLSDVYADVKAKGSNATWSRYAVELYGRLRRKAEREGWMDKFRYLLYEDKIVVEDVDTLQDMAGVLLQSKAGENGKSRNEAIAAAQA
jgi:hypothetical protein